MERAARPRGRTLGEEKNVRDEKLIQRQEWFGGKEYPVLERRGINS